MSPSFRIATLLLQVILVGQSVARFTSFPASNGTAQNSARQACDQLQSSLGSSIVQSSGANYEFAAMNAWNLENAQYQPTCMVFPRNTRNVQIAMKAIYAAKSHYAVQAGSHSAMKGWNTWVLIIFSNMKNASYDAVKDSITLEPGIHWLEAVTALESFGVAPVGGKDVGTGLLLGGGLSYLSPSQGYAADNFKELDVVLVTGEMVTATAANEYSDLFRALKGGTNRFGIVTRYELYPYNSSAEALLKTTARYAVLFVSMSNLIADGSRIPVYLAVLLYNGPNLPTELFGDFLSIPSMASQLGPLSYFDISGLLEDRGRIQHFGASALVGEDHLFLDAFTHWTNFTTAFQDNLYSTTLAFTPIPDSQIQAKGGNRSLNPFICRIPPSVGLPLYVNECDSQQKVFKTYGAYNLLKATLRSMIQNGDFNVEHTGGPIGL
ncbi:hypothetical protein C8R43DRAFT_1088002 [Mycena crocata]|nr:hypothetical protein C8R43DRAFT_1088002 [Mycena crocata]